jgi:hypothetical protein
LINDDQRVAAGQQATHKPAKSADSKIRMSGEEDVHKYVFYVFSFLLMLITNY